MPTLGHKAVENFIETGFVRVDEAFPRRLAEECRAILWRNLDGDPEDPTSWTKPVVRLSGYRQEPFRKTANAPRLCSAFDEIVGTGRWRPRSDLGTFVVRFPSDDNPDDMGWHIDSSFPAEDSKPGDYSTWRVNLKSRARALLLLFLLSDVDENDAPTRLRVASHLDMVSILEPFGAVGVSSKKLSSLDLDAASTHRPEALATGAAGTVYICHPFLIHAAQAHNGTTPRFLAQPELPPAEPFQLHRADGDYSPVERAILRGLDSPANG
ncbi:MAG: phytanoyl-CoA dioxygenase [Alphaproteobacteria bacterium]|nr:phytanoyl-CoA dioxygenase [Alphaproteobacteria bacterium]